MLLPCPSSQDLLETVDHLIGRVNHAVGLDFGVNSADFTPPLYSGLNDRRW